MDLDTHEVLWLSCYLDGSTEGDDTVDVGHSGLAYIGIAIPRTCSLPGKTIGSPAVCHDGWDAVVVISCHVVVLACFCQGILVLPLLRLPLRQLLFELRYPVFVLIVLLPEPCGLGNACLGNLFKKVFILTFQGGYHGTEGSNLGSGLGELPVEIREVEVILHDRGHHGAVFAVLIE